MARRFVNPHELAEPKGFSHGILVENNPILFLAGQDASDSDGNIVGKNDILTQFTQVLENLSTVVREAGGDPDDIVKLNIFVVDRQLYLDHLKSLGEIFDQFLSHYPAMAFFEIEALYKSEALIEMEGFAAIGSSS